MKYLLEDRERNGYDDSDFYAIFYDTETGSIRSEEYGSTRYAGGYRVAPPEYIREIPEEILLKISEVIYSRVSDYARETDRREIDEPDSVSIGESLTLLSSGTFKDKRSGAKIPYSEGESGVVIWEGAFGTFYRNGYNRKGRSNTRVGIRFEDGRSIFVGLDRCKLSRPYLTEQEIDERATRAAAAGYRSCNGLFF